MNKKISRTKTKEFCINSAGWSAGILLFFVYAAVIVSAIKMSRSYVPLWKMLGIPAAGVICAVLSSRGRSPCLSNSSKPKTPVYPAKTAG
jgi:hypothetical protein